jgi:glycerophosphoryl diester phosphodiesterase
MILNKDKNQPLIMAHRGFSAKYVENSLEAFDQALEAGAEVLECDIQACRTGELILMHDKTTDRTCQVDAKVPRLSLAEIKKIPLRNNQEIPTLEEFILRYQGRVRMMWDVKSPTAAKEVVRLINQYHLHDGVLVSSTISSLLVDILIRDPEISTSIAFGPQKYLKYMIFKKLFVLPARLVGAQYATVHYKFVSQAMINRAHENGLRILAFPVNHEIDMIKFANWHIDGMIGNDPILIKKVLKNINA